MKKTLLLIMILIFPLAFSAEAQDQVTFPSQNPFSMTVTLNSDIFFGFYPFFSGSYNINQTTAFTFYGILWSGGTGGAWGNWTEFGVGISLTPINGLTINPQIGLLNGSLTSGLGTPTLAEGIVPNLTVGLNTDNIEGEIYGGYYLGFDHGNPNTNNYLHYWINGGYKLGRIVSAGLHLEQLRFMGGNNHSEVAAFDYYTALGPYLQFSAPDGGAFARFTAAGDLRGQDQIDASGYDASTFFKLTVGYSF